MIIYFLLILIIIFTIIAYFIEKRDIFSPAVLLCAGYLVACMSCAFNIKKWGVELRLNTMGLILVGILFFAFGVFFIDLISRKKSLKANEMSSIEIIELSWSKIIFFAVFDSIVLFLSIKDMLKISGGWLSTFNQTMNQFRMAYSYTDTSVNPIVVQLMKISKGAAYTFLYVFFNNISITNKGKKIKNNIKYLIPVVIYLVLTLFRGGRLNIIMMMVAGLFMYYFTWHRKLGWDKTISGKFIKRFIISFVVFTLIFFGTRELVGRQSQSTLIDYVTMYFGGSFQLLDQYLNTSNLNIVGAETFPGIQQSLYKLGIGNEVIHKSLEFRTTPTGIYLGNIYTGLRRFYHDYGWWGLIIMQFIYGALFEFLYIKIKRIKILNTNNLFLVIIYSSILFAPITQAMEDHFWIDLGLGYIIELIIMWICVKWIMEFRLSRNKIIRKSWHEIPKTFEIMK